LGPRKSWVKPALQLLAALVISRAGSSRVVGAVLSEIFAE
jgi:hypothetical protein